MKGIVQSFILMIMISSNSLFAQNIIDSTELYGGGKLYRVSYKSDSSFVYLDYDSACQKGLINKMEFKKIDFLTFIKKLGVFPKGEKKVYINGFGINEKKDKFFINK